ncbi:histidine kinase N-terminal 7TM domain-containing protein [Natrinema salsiterrestre]|uniref:histidine kinase n=1 Tax=Natrinema salsiterrestre TaxID=2950540 RepID=A0A9Q4L1U0_9EURY|nr:histidine kinase N-terminal 7TM domain-containing protein [Natrinema salsiterrestre]MDF9746077.1 ATP-binding protein [Natrinema salsiterrestre]
MTELFVLIVLAINALSPPIAIGLSYIAWKHRDNPGARFLIVVLIGTALWGGSLFIFSVTTDPTIGAIALRTMFTSSIATVGMLLFALDYTGLSRYITTKTIVLAACYPVLVLSVATVNPNGVFFQTFEADPTALGGFALEFGPAFYGHVVTSYVLTGIVSGLFLGSYAQSQNRYRGQYLVLAAGTMATVVANAATVFGPFTVDVTPVGLVVAGVAYTWAFRRYRFMDLVPVARDRVLESIDHGVLLFDPENRLIDANRSGRRFIDMNDVDPIGLEAEDALETVPELRDWYAEATGERTELTLDDRHVEAVTRSLEGVDGAAGGTLLLLHDVTEQKRQQRVLERRNEQLDQFAAIVSHDLRNPLNVADGYVDIARDTGDLTVLEEVDRSLDRMDAIIDGVLTLTRADEDAIDPEPVSLAGIARTAWETVDTGDATLEGRPEVSVLADPEPLTRLLENLYRNAVEHGGDDVSVRVDTTPTGDGFVVSDDGPGIPAAERDQVLEGGYTTGKGTGLGLAIVEQIASAHGWEVRVTESQSGGAAFEFTEIETAAAPVEC